MALTTLGSSFSCFVNDRRRERRDVDCVIGERREAGAHNRRFDCRQIALHIDHDIIGACRVHGAERLENAVGAAGMIRAGHDRLAAGGRHRFDDARVVRRHPDRSEVRLHRPAPDMDDHRRAVDVGEGLPRQAGRAHAGGDEDDGVGHQLGSSESRGARAYTCCQGERKAANQLGKKRAPAAFRSIRSNSSRRRFLRLWIMLT